jgi:hypothetical protein
MTKEDLYRAVRKLKAMPPPPPLPVRVSMSTEKLRELLLGIFGSYSEEDLAGDDIKIYGMQVVIQEHLGEMVSIALDNGGFLLWNGSVWLQIPPLEMVHHLPVVTVRWE